ncbi:5-oxoprolinase subunit PxpA [Dickeya sp. CFBP 2040]|uniref:5-oxoprolinase subunit PxpA n=1 Tax=Dickeya sp. CFBP 2040 TaxID=2718531 RepID=UPI001445B1BA|nr:5-oxoprolinase subunit PxpA [Dickeya sp. CFBP 2040]NKI73267.1 5-oxoprolinase subunit PxpA [Dickeya sp. CFBP 2040]
MKYEIDLNSDMGENFGPWKIGDDVDRDIMSYISSANIAAGFHAGDPSTIRQTIEWAKECGVAVGAHPGFRDLVGFGRRHIHSQPSEMVNDILYQLGAVREFTRLYQLPLQHVKPHGALYMHLAHDQLSAQLFVQALHRLDPELRLFCLYGSWVWQEARKLQHPVICEFYGDREYDASGSIVFTRRVGALEPAAVAAKVVRACVDGKVTTIDGEDIPVEFESICIHSDTPGALALIQATREALNNANIHVCSPF